MGAPPFFGEEMIERGQQERQAKAGKLILEVRANGRGLMPELDQLVDLRVDGFKQTAVDGGDLSVTQFDKESLETVRRRLGPRAKAAPPR